MDRNALARGGSGLHSSVGRILPSGPRQAQIREALEQRVPLPFTNGAPLDEVLATLRAATRSPRLPNGIEFYADPIALQEAEKTMKSTVAINLDDVPLKASLRLLLKQLGLDYVVRDSFVLILGQGDVLAEAVAERDARALRMIDDPAQDVLGSVLALFAACVGMVIAPMLRREGPGLTS